MSKIPSKSLSIPIRFVTLRACALEPFVKIIFFPSNFLISSSKSLSLSKNLDLRHEQILKIHQHLFCGFLSFRLKLYYIPENNSFEFF